MHSYATTYDTNVPVMLLCCIPLTLHSCDANPPTTPLGLGWIGLVFCLFMLSTNQRTQVDDSYKQPAVLVLLIVRSNSHTISPYDLLSHTRYAEPILSCIGPSLHFFSKSVKWVRHRTNATQVRRFRSDRCYPYRSRRLWRRVRPGTGRFLVLWDGKLLIC